VAKRFRIARMYRTSEAAPQPIKIALVLSGAVALGSFEAGVAYELLSAVGRGAAVTVDIVTGSSAGTLVGAMTAKSLATGVPFEYVLPRWTEFTLRELTSAYETEEEARRRGKPLDRGILSSEAVRRIMEAYLVDDPVERSFQPAYPAPRVVLTMTMTNLDGLTDPEHPLRDPRFSEAVVFRFTPPDPRRLWQSPYPPPVWRRVAHIGKASAAFPGAFDPESVPWKDRIQIPGLLEEMWENHSILERLHRLDPDVQRKMRYADGGILDEQPVERAITVFPMVTGGRGESGEHTLVYDPRRCILFIEPDPFATSLDALKAGSPTTWFSTFTRGVRLWSLSASPASSHKRVQATNTRQEKLFLFLADLARSMREERITPSAGAAQRELSQRHPELADGGVRGGLGEPTGLIDPDLYKRAVHSFYDWLTDHQRFEADMGWLDRLPTGRVKEAHNAVRAALVVLRDAYLSLDGVDPVSPGRYQAVLEEMHALLAQSLGLAQPWVALYQITPEDPKQMLKGEEIVHFGGFFSEEFLRHDFEVGRYYAHLWLKQTVPDYVSPEEPEQPPITEDGISWRLLWSNRTPLWRMVGRLVSVLLEAIGLAPGGMAQLLVRVLGWSLLLSLLHGLLLLVGAWFGWVTFPPQYQQFRVWVLMGASLFPLAVGLVLGMALRKESLRAIRSVISGKKAAREKTKSSRAKGPGPPGHSQ